MPCTAVVVGEMGAMVVAPSKHHSAVIHTAFSGKFLQATKLSQLGMTEHLQIIL